MKIYNVNPDERTGLVEIPVEHEHVPLEEFITNLRAAAKGLSDCTVEVNVEDDFDYRHVEVCVSGTRTLSDAEISDWMRRHRPSPVDRATSLVQHTTPEEREHLLAALIEIAEPKPSTLAVIREFTENQDEQEDT